MFRRLTYIALNPFFQALIVAGAIILFLPTGIQKYYARQADMITFFNSSKYFFADLDHDGSSQYIQTFYNESANVGVVIRSGQNPYDQVNFKGIYNDFSPRLMIGDFNRNNLEEVYLFTLVEDSVFLQAIEYGRTQKYFINNKFITRIGKNLKEPDYLIIPGKITDMTGDGFGDLVFALSAGFSLYPRQVYIYDIAKDLLIVSPESGAAIDDIHFANLDDDPYDEIILSTCANDNYNEKPVSYSDSSSWLMVLDHNLKFIFPPVEFPGMNSNVRAFPFYIPDSQEPMILCFAKYVSGNKFIKSLLLYDYHGSPILSNDLGIATTASIFNIVVSSYASKGRDIIAYDQSGFFSLEKDLELKKIKELDLSKRPPEFIDIDQDQEDEILVLSPDQTKYIIYRNDFSYPVEIDFPIQQRRPLLSVKLNGHKPPQLSVQGDQVWKLFDYGINPLWRFRFLIWFGIYLSILTFILIIRKLYSFQLKRRYETEKKIATLQLSSVKAQMEPHFIMNTINTIGSSIYRKKPDEAYQLLLNFSGMVRSLLLSSDKFTRSLKEELDFVRNYLELERTRFTEVFSYAVNIADDVNPEALIPKMIIQLHAENALKHGLLPKKTGGFLDISVTKEEDHLVITITDNGIGRNLASKNISQSTGKGMKILAQFFETYNKHNKNQLRQEIVDLYDEARNPAGTQVKVYVPVDFNSGIF